MKLGLIQQPIKLGDIEKNKKCLFANLTQLLNQKTRLVVAPELWATGFDYPRLNQWAEITPKLIEEIKEHLSPDSLFIGSFAEKVQNKIYNMALIISKKGILGQYAKIHLFTPNKEDLYFEAGHQISLFQINDLKLGLMICYDLRFPELARKLALQGAQLLIIPAAWPSIRISHWQALLQARAIENQVFVAGVNACGYHGKLKMGGHSAIIAPDGKILAAAGNKATILTADIDPKLIEKTRSLIPCFENRREDLYG